MPLVQWASGTLDKVVADQACECGRAARHRAVALRAKRDHRDRPPAGDRDSLLVRRERQQQPFRARDVGRQAPLPKLYVYRDTYRGKLVTAKVRNGEWPIMHEVVRCLRRLSVRREGPALVIECPDRIARYDTRTSQVHVMELNERLE